MSFLLSTILRVSVFLSYLSEISYQVKVKNISGHRVKVEYGFRKTRTRELVDPDQIIEIDDFDYDYLDKLGVFSNKEFEIVNEADSDVDKMAKAKQDVENYINQK